MVKKLITGGALIGLTVAGGVAVMVSAQTVANETGLTEEQVTAIALLEVPGEVQEVELERKNGTQVYEIAILSDDGQEKEIEIAAGTGDVLEIEAEGDGCGKDRGR